MTPSIGSYEDWIAHAESDLALARLAVGNQDVMASQICFHAQQAAEKAIKAILLFKKIPFPFTHDLEELIDVAEKGGLQISERVRDVGRLTPFAVETRYPGTGEAVGENEISDSLELAASVIDWAKTSRQS